MVIKKKKYSLSAATLVLAAVITTAPTFVVTPNIAIPAAATTATQPPSVTETTDNKSVNVLINWEPREIEPNQDIEFTLDFQDPSSGESIPHVNYNFEIVDENGETIQSMTDLHTHSGSDMQTVTFDTAGSFRLVVAIIGTGINPPFDTTQSGTAETAITVGQESPVVPDSNNSATTTDNATITSAPSSGIELSSQPIFQDQVRGVSETPINQTHSESTVSGNGTLTLPNTTETIRTTSRGSLMITMEGATAAAAGKEILTTEDGSENATATLYEIAQFNMQEGTGKGIAIAVVHTNSTGKLAPLNGMILTGQEEFKPDGSRLVTMWEWQSGIPLPTSTTGQAPPIINITTTTNATADTNVTVAATPDE